MSFSWHELQIFVFFFCLRFFQVAIHSILAIRSCSQQEMT